MNVKSITLTYDQVAAILEEHINREILRTPHHVTAVDPWDWDFSDEHQFAISLAPLADARPVLPPADALRLLDVIPCMEPLTVGSAGNNGHILHGAAEPIGDRKFEENDEKHEETVPAAAGAGTAPAADRKIRATKPSPAQYIQVLELRTKHTPIGDIAAQTGITEGQVYAVLAQARTEGFEDPDYRRGGKNKVGEGPRE